MSTENKILYVSNINLKAIFLPLDRANRCDHTTSPIAAPLSDGLRFDNSLYFWWWCMGIQMATESRTCMNCTGYYLQPMVCGLNVSGFMILHYSFCALRYISIIKVKCWHLYSTYMIISYFLPHISYFYSRRPSSGSNARI